ncbi:hypothetical protein M1B34_13970 [Pseudomonas sp. MAFF 302030]|uniref:Uncharacterized protein n=1 Tax=Pseudomonas morbosilactucae TaxID=2938197 RepID=A0A9X1YVQ4_9PSED|nr:hypothetical protein [Pseudomonas morbosilactucae]MCK9798799.1 hypothetical protein [Pseudomonas morbosilactucae]
MHATGPTFEKVLRKIVKQVLTYWTQIGTLIGLSAAGLGMLSLYMYTRAIGRTDLFMDAIDAKSALLVWLFMVLVMMGIFLILLCVTTVLFGLATSLFHRTADRTKDVVVWLALPVLVGFSSIVVAIYYASGSDWWLIIGLLMIFPVSCWGVLSRQAFQQVIAANLETPTGSAPRDRVSFLLSLLACLLGTVIAALFPTMLAMNAYVNEVSNDSAHPIASLSLLTLVLTLLPVVVFHHKAGSVYKRALYAVLCVILIAVVFLLMLPGAMSQITTKAAGGLDIRQSVVERFVLRDDIELLDLDPLVWNTRLMSQNHLEIQGFQLFSFGDVLLICPQGLRQLPLNQMHSYTQQCIKTRNSAVTRKPTKWPYARKLDCGVRAAPSACWAPPTF